MTHSPSLIPGIEKICLREGDGEILELKLSGGANIFLGDNKTDSFRNLILEGIRGALTSERNIVSPLASITLKDKTLIMPDAAEPPSLLFEPVNKFLPMRIIQKQISDTIRGPGVESKGKAFLDFGLLRNTSYNFRHKIITELFKRKIQYITQTPSEDIIKDFSGKGPLTVFRIRYIRSSKFPYPLYRTERGISL